MKLQTKVDDRLPLPARQLLAVVKTLTKASKQVAEQHIHEGHVSVNGRVRTQAFSKLDVGDRVEIEFSPPVSHSTKDIKTHRVFEVLYEDDDIIAVNKPAFLLTVPTLHKEKNTLIGQINRYLAKQDKDLSAYCVHRLDRGVSGVLIFAKSLPIAEKLRNQFADRKPKRQYVAIVAGSIDQPDGTMRSHLATDDDLNQYSTGNTTEGQLAITHYRVAENWSEATMVEIWLETGRRNQIRVHFAEAGHPVLGDPRYQRNLAKHPGWPYERLALHAESLQISHPRTGRMIEWRTPWPDEFRAFRRRLKRD